MKVLRRVLIVTFLAVLVVSYYIYLTSKSASDVEANKDDTEVGQLLATNMDLNYPANPRDVVIFYTRIIKAYYGEKYTDDQLIGLAQHARALFDEELLEYNDFDEYMARLKEEIEVYASKKKVIADYTIERASDNVFLIDDGVQYAKVKVLYYTKEGKSTREKVYEQYTLRQGDDGRWKIVYWEVIPETIVKGD